MNIIPSISSQIDEKIIFKVIDKHFSRLAPHYYKWINNWLIGAYENYADIDKYIILIYIINKDFIFFRRNGLIVDYETFYKDKSLEVDKINISDISKDLQIPKESVRRKVEELEKADVIKKKGKKIFITRTAFTTAQANLTLKNMTTLLYEFNKILEEEKIIKIAYQSKEILDSIKNSGIDNMEIYRAGNRLFMIIETNSKFSFDRKKQLDRKNNYVQKWERLMSQYQKNLPFSKPGEKWVLMKKIFSF